LYIQVKLISTVYERLVKARQLIKDETVALFKSDEWAQERFDMFVSIVLTAVGPERRFEQA
jgi:hypothetical protein